jgi:hypothetical protein
MSLRRAADLVRPEETEASMGWLELVLLIGGAWCAGLVLVVAALGVASRADDRTDELTSATMTLPRHRAHRHPGRAAAG